MGGATNANYTPVDVVVKQSLKALEKNQANVVTGGLSNQLVVNASRFLPRETLVTAVEKQFKSNGE